jgi:hypothetical protein
VQRGNGNRSDAVNNFRCTASVCFVVSLFVDSFSISVSFSMFACSATGSSCTISARDTAGLSCGSDAGSSFHLLDLLQVHLERCLSDQLLVRLL